MMRTLMVVALLALTVVAVAQEQAKEVKRYEVAVSTDEFVAGVDGLADVLKKHLSGPTEEYYQVVLAKHKAFGLIAKAAGAASIIAFAICMSLISRAVRCKDAHAANAHTVFATVYGIMWLVATIAFCALSGDIVAPEYYALHEVIQAAQGFMP